MPVQNTAYSGVWKFIQRLAEEKDAYQQFVKRK